MSFTLYINDVDKSGFVAPDTLSIVDQLDGRNTCTFGTRHKTDSYKGEIGHHVEVYDDAVCVFVGIITDRELAQIDDVTGYEYTYTCADYTTLATRHVIGWNYENMQADDIVLHINQYFLTGEGISAEKTPTGFVEEGVFVTTAIFNYCTVFDALNQIAELCGYSWYIDYDKKLHFFARGSKTAPYSLTDAQRNYITLRASEKISQYRNKQYMRGGNEDSEDRTEYFHGDGKINQFNLLFPLSRAPTITLNGVAQTVGISGVDVDKDWYWSAGSPTITQANPYEAYKENVLVEYDFNKTENDKIYNGGSINNAELTLNDIDIKSDVGGRCGYLEGDNTSYGEDGTALVLPDAFTLEWIGTVEEYAIAYHALAVHRSAAAVGWGFYCKTVDKKLQFYSSPVVFSVSSNTPLTYETVCHATITYNKTGGQDNFKMYLNGLLDATATYSASPQNPPSGTKFYLGHDLGASYYHLGRDYLCRVYSIALDPLQVMTNVLAERPRYQTIQRGVRLTATDALAVTYQFAFPVFEVMENTDKQAERAAKEGGGTGVYETILDDATLNDTTWTEEKATRLIEKYGEIPEILTFTTHKPGLRAGQLITVNLPELGLDDDYLIDRVECVDQSFAQYTYTVEALSGESLGGWADFFLSLRGQTFTLNPTAALLLLSKLTSTTTASANLSETHGAPAHNEGIAKVGFGECTS